MLNLGVIDKLILLPLETQKKIVAKSRHNGRSDPGDLNHKDHEDIYEFLHQLNLLRSNKDSETFSNILNFIKFPVALREFYETTTVFDESYLHYNYKWRIDISVPKANAILVNINKQNGGNISFRLDVTTFHKLRFNITLMLNEISKLKKNVNRIKRVN